MCERCPIHLAAPQPSPRLPHLARPHLSRPHLVTPRPRLLHPQTTPGATQLHNFASGWRAARLPCSTAPTAPICPLLCSLFALARSHKPSHHPPSPRTTPSPTAACPALPCPSPPLQAPSVCCPPHTHDAGGGGRPLLPAIDYTSLTQGTSTVSTTTYCD